MRDRFITWGSRDGARRLFVFELDIEDFQIIRREIPEEHSTQEMLQTVINAWNQHTTIHYPEGSSSERIPFSASGTIVPAGAEVEDKVRVASAEREWPAMVLSSAMSRQFSSELEELAETIKNLEDYDENIFERAKSVWTRVQQERTNQALRHDDTENLKVQVDEIFEQLKKLRRGDRKRQNEQSKQIKAEFQARLQAAQSQLEAKKDLQGLFQQLRDIQADLKSAPFRREDPTVLMNRLDELFKATKAERSNSPEEINRIEQQRSQIERRLEGLQKAIARMRNSIKRDQTNANYENRRVERAPTQLAEQLAAAKLMIIHQQSDSKQSVLDDMLATEAMLLKKLEKLAAKAKKSAGNKPSNKAKAPNEGGPSGKTGKTPKGKEKQGDQVQKSQGEKATKARTAFGKRTILDAAAVISIVEQKGEES